MPDLLHVLTTPGLAELGRASVPALWIPMAAWTVFAGIGEGTLRLTQVHPTAAVRIRSALLLALPLVLLVPPVFAWLVPDAAHAVAAVRPPQLTLPEIPIPLESVAEPIAPPIAWVALGLVTLAIGLASAIGLLQWGWALLRLRRVRRGLDPAPEPIRNLLAQTSQSLGLRQPVEVALCDDRTAPFTFGWRHPVVAVPPTLTGEPLRLALAHELAHVRHRDFFWNALEQGIAALGIAHPIVRLVAQGAVLGREQAADAAVLAARPSERRVYADLLLSYASLPAPGLTLGASQGSSFLHTRIAAMTRTLSPTRLRQLVVAGRSIGLLAGLLLVGGATALAVPEAAAALDPPEWLEGRVTDASTQEGIRGASVVAVAERVGAATVEDGNYRLRRPEGEFELQVSASGYVPQTVQVGANQDQLDVALRPAEGAEAEAQRAAVARRLGTSQTDDQGATPPDIYVVVESPPQLIGGLDGLQRRVVYPPEAKEQGLEGRVFVEFVVDEEGRVQDPVAVRSPHPMLSEAALEAIRESEFIPGRQRGVAVKVRYSLPVSFILHEDSSRTGANRPRGTPGPDENGIYNVVEQAPQLIGGLEGLQARVEYPELAERAGIGGRVFVTFVVDEQGRVQDAAIARTPDPMLGEAALKAVQESEFTPGLQRGQPVKVRYSLPVNFRLRSGTSSDGEDRGFNQERRAPRPQRLFHAGIDLALLENADLVRIRLQVLSHTLDAQHSPPTEVEYRYTLHPNGTFSDVRVVRPQGTSEIAEAGAEIVAAMILKTDRRPPTRREGMFRLTYVGT